MTYRSVVTALVVCGLVPRLALAADDVFDSNGVKIHYVTAGKGEAVVLIHGWMSDSGMWGRLDTNPATKEYQLVALDCRGHGKSDKPHDATKYDAEVAADVVRLLDHLKIEKAHLVGYSSGSFVAGKVAATYPDRVRSVVFGGQAPVIGEVKESDFSEVELFAKLVDEGKDLGEYLLAVLPKGSKPTAEQAKAIAGFLYAGKDVKAFAAAGRGYKKLAVTEEELKRCKAPMLFIHGGDESDHVKGKVTAARTALGRGELKVIDGGNHMTTLTKPEFGSSINTFLRHGKLE
ncbi:MAG: alpha/beta hydrolase [Gemmataceae bacterium]|nr:alpha/beta hydrolase [Gemmataceae bacterium]